MIKKLVKFWPLLLLLFLTFFLRIIKLEELFYFTYDESIPAFVGRRLFLNWHIPLIGGVTPMGVHLPPYFYWFLAVILKIGRFNPIEWGYAGAALAVLTTFILFRLGLLIGNKKLAITASILWTFSYLANVYDRHFWALWWGPLVSIIVLYSLIKIASGKKNFVYLLALGLIIGITTDPSNLVFILLATIIYFLYKIKFAKQELIAILLIIFSLSPLVIFDLRHNFANSKPFLRYWQEKTTWENRLPTSPIQNSLIFPKTFSRLIYTTGDNEISKQYSYCPDFVKEKYNKVSSRFILASLVIILIFILSTFIIKTTNSGWRIMSILIILYFFGIQIYGTVNKSDIFEHYVTGLFAIFLLLFAKFLSKLPKPIWLISLALFMIFNLAKLVMAKNELGLKHKREAIEFTMQQVGDRQFSLDSLSTCWKYSGYRYLFTVFGREPVKSYVDPNFAYLYGNTHVADKHPPTVVVFVSHDFSLETEEFYKRYAYLKSHEVKSAVFGRIEVIIIDNSTGWF